MRFIAYHQQLVVGDSSPIISDKSLTTNGRIKNAKMIIRKYSNFNQKHYEIYQP
ncbi:hypothetical protein NJ959_25315 [Symplocastrum sp. BBK-W-15]|uniref:Uncharacterized protein n=1 Tax=Limnofasciculus baicalensis BBK-W-15 TaxID=2699891 RepID=A0AAE3GWI3_9CYAN|nr:hypothetical protein [Limnofasciculus baicalensis BBK-W-15]